MGNSSRGTIQNGVCRVALNEGMGIHKIFVDECGMNMFTSRTQGRAERGMPAVRINHGQRGRNLTICLAVSERLGLVHHNSFTGGQTQQRFSDFLMELAVLVDEPFVVIFDNASSHERIPGFPRADQSHKHLPPYSPFLNPVENAISCLKAEIKRQLAIPENRNRFDDPARANEQGVPMQQYRLQCLEELARNSLGEITVVKCQNWYNHTFSYIPRCLAGEELLV